MGHIEITRTLGRTQGIETRRCEILIIRLRTASHQNIWHQIVARELSVEMQFVRTEQQATSSKQKFLKKQLWLPNGSVDLCP